ncbi:hypothetical protein K435DRAFT_961129 [Dendrothele bispora CBS 962.96]|uniref:DUF4048 domain-containing protein n=1 Tax=Dendrothele bispora (strain CBS 962.96) TaxID=1314807 RepID=A0A4S8MRA6_DENBC|nr:hypothetical protein K435DRAFT_961129 [Dendrothele bispora CBS 962.96]
MATTGPRPLRLANESPSTPSTPSTPSSNLNFASSSRAPNTRRQSSISYIHSSREGEPTSPALFIPRHANPYATPNSPHSPIFSSSKPALARSNSVGSHRSVDGLPTRTFATPTTPVFERSNGRFARNPNRTSTGSILEPTAEEKQRPPLTLVEKHAELLQFIAQKESKCLELRTQLATHEAELLELKKKWGRIVSRGLERSQSEFSSDSQSSVSTSSLKSPVPLTSTSPPSNLYSAASLSYLENLSTQAQNAGSGAVFETLGGIGGMKGIRDSVQQGVGRFLGVVAGNGANSPLSPSATLPPSKPSSAVVRKDHTHNPSQSTSSVATGSSVTSLSGTGSDAGTRLSHSSQSSVDILAEEGLGVSNKDRRRPASLTSVITDTGATPLMSPTSEFGFSFDGTEATSNCTSVSRSNSVRSRRKSKQSPLSNKEVKSENISPSDQSSKGHHDSESLSSSLLDWSSLEDSSALREAKQINNYAKRMSLPLDGGSVSSWVGNVVGRKWEDTLNKNQKRASVLLSDVSQTISQLVSPPPSATPTTQSPFSTVERPSPISRSPSLLDDDLPDSEGHGDALRSMPLLQPSTPTPTAKSSTLQPLPAQTRLMTVSPKTSPSKQRHEDDDDEWNW